MEAVREPRLAGLGLLKSPFSAQFSNPRLAWDLLPGCPRAAPTQAYCPHTFTERPFACGAHASPVCDVPLGRVASPGREKRDPTLQPPTHPLPPSAPSQLSSTPRTCGPGMRAFGQPRGPRDSDEGWVVRSNSTREVAFAWSQLTLSLTPADSGKIQAAGAIRARGARGNLSRLPSPLQGTRSRVHAGLRSTLGLDSSTASGKDTGPLEARCSEPQQPPAGFRVGVTVDFPISPESTGTEGIWKGGCLGRRSGPEPQGTPGSGANPGRKRAAPPLRVQAQPGWLRIKEPGPSFCAFRSYLRPRSGAARPPTSRLECPLFLPSGGWEGG